MAIWSNLLMAGCCLTAQAQAQAQAPPPAPDARIVTFEVRWMTVMPSWLESVGEARLHEIDRAGETAVWAADEDVIKDLVQFGQASVHHSIVQLPRLTAPENVETVIDRPYSVPLNLAVEHEGTTSRPRKTSVSKIGTVDLKQRLSLAADYVERADPASAASWRIKGSIERSDVSQAISTIAAKEQVTVIGVPKVVRYGIEGTWRLDAGQVLVARLGRGPFPVLEEGDSPFFKPSYDFVMIIQPKLAPPGTAPIALPVTAAVPAPRGLLKSSPLHDDAVARTSGVIASKLVEKAPKSQASAMTSKAYHVGDIVGTEMLPALAKTLIQKVEPTYWREDLDNSAQPVDPSKGSVVPFYLNVSVIVRASPEMHERIAKKLDFWREARLNEISAETLFGPRP